MIFLNPSVLIGLIAASIPLIIHLLNLRKLDKVEFSTLAFLKELQRSKIKKIKIKQWLLLLLRTLIIISLVIAFARPTIEESNFLVGSSSAKTSALFILDNSFSMSYVENDGSYFNKSKKVIKEIVSKMNDGDDFNILISSDSVFNTKSKSGFLKHLDKLVITERTEPLYEHLIKGYTTLDAQENINKELYIFSDFQASTFQFDTKYDSLDSSFGKENIRLFAFSMIESERRNYSVSNLALDNTILEINKPISFTATFNNYSNTLNDRVMASLFLNDKRVAQKEILFDKKEVSETFSTSINTSGLNKARIEIEDDGILNDNVRYLNFSVPEEIKTLILFNNKKDIVFIEAALKSATTSSQIKITRNKISENKVINYNDFNVIFLSSTSVPNALRNYLDSGGNVIFIPPAQLLATQIANLEILGFDNLQQPILVSAEGNNYNEISDIDFDHPLFEDLFESNDNQNFESPRIFKHLKIPKSSNHNSIITLLDESTFLGEYNIGKGKVIFLNISTDLSWSNFSIKGIFAPLISRCVAYLSASNNQQNNVYVGEPIQLNLNKIIIPLIEVETPLGVNKFSTSEKDGEIYSYLETSVSGSYIFDNNNNIISSGVVNINPLESDLSTISTDRLNNEITNMFGKNYLLFSSNDNYIDRISTARFGTELWKHFLILALILAMLEMFLSKSSKKDIVNINENN